VIDDGGLTIEVSETNVDYFALEDLKTIGGFQQSLLSLSLTSPGPLVIRNSSIESLSVFRHLGHIYAEASSFTVNNKPYGVAIYGLEDMLVHQNS
jgi:hypothetical protein